MKLYSTQDNKHRASFKEALFRGQAPNKGLYLPLETPKLPSSFFDRLPTLTLAEIALEVSAHLLKDEIPVEDLTQLMKNAFNFDAPLVPVTENISALELFHGPTLAFKDFGARFMAELFSYYLKQSNKEILILVATSGDTGSAVANGFLGKENIKVVILYPSGRVSNIQEMQIATNTDNIFALEVDGAFDDCQQLVKMAFADEALNSQLNLSSANSINIARLIPQSFYYFYAASKLMNRNQEIIFSVPSGNFGNLTAGLLAKKLGLPVKKFIAAVNENDTFYEFLKNGSFSPKKSVATISNAMDVGNPSNFARINSLYGGSIEGIRKDVTCIKVSDKETRATIKQVYKDHNYILDPHGAVGYSALSSCLDSSDMGIFLETAHPAKFYEVVEAEIGASIPMPKRLATCLKRTKTAKKMASDFEELKSKLAEISQY